MIPSDLRAVGEISVCTLALYNYSEWLLHTLKATEHGDDNLVLELNREKRLGSY